MNSQQPQRDLESLHVVITGGGGALGAGVVERLLLRGAICHLPMRDREVPEGFAFAQHKGVSTTTGVDLTDEDAVVGYFASLPSLWGSVHLAGGFAMGAIDETPLSDLQRMWDLNAVTCFLSCREAVRALRRSQTGGRIVNVGARAVVQPAANMVAYIASKAGVAAITEALAVEVLTDGILVNAILPSIIDSPANRRSMPTADHHRWPTPAAIADTIAFLVSPQNQLTSGALIPVYGAA